MNSLDAVACALHYMPGSVGLHNYMKIANSMLEWLFYKHSIVLRGAGSIDNSLDMCRVCGCPITRLTNQFVDPPSFAIREGNLKTHGQTLCLKHDAFWTKAMQCGWKMCSASGHFYDSVQSVAVWCTDDRKNHLDFYQNRGLFFHSFGIITKVDNLQIVTNNKLGKFYGLKCLFWWPKVEAFWIYSVTLCNVLGLKNQLWW